MQKEEKKIRSLGEDGNENAVRIRGRSRASRGTSRASRAVNMDVQ